MTSRGGRLKALPTKGREQQQQRNPTHSAHETQLRLPNVGRRGVIDFLPEAIIKARSWMERRQL